MSRKSLAALAMITAGLFITSAQADPIVERKALMRAVGAATGALSAMAKGETPFDLRRAQAAFATFSAAGAHYPSLFPATSKTGGDTDALAKIWEDAAGFAAANAKFSADSAAALVAVKDIETLRTSFGAVARNCGTCHESFRAKRG